jgi:polysaccharide export outer membrane protein
VISSKSLKLRGFLKFLMRWTGSLAATLLLSPAMAGEPPTAAAPVAVQAAPAGAQQAAQDTAAAAVSPDYRIGPGDTLKVSVFQNENLTATLPVRPDGKISTPLVEDMVAVGKTPSQLARDIEKSLAEYIKSPKVSVVVTVALSIYSQVKVIGQVKTPESLPFREGMTVLDAVLAVGGLGQFAACNRAQLIRTENGKQTEIKVKLDSLLNSGDMKQNLPLRPGDVLVVPETRF